MADESVWKELEALLGRQLREVKRERLGSRLPVIPEVDTWIPRGLSKAQRARISAYQHHHQEKGCEDHFLECPCSAKVFNYYLGSVHPVFGKPHAESEIPPFTLCKLGKIH